mmetsp:Transcript_52667/g.133099  ORF Transcript_52667/g.133099 Transcript_52667/m.133099 type:complete len:695 (+) Transcript_52667:70-2154(+)
MAVEVADVVQQLGDKDPKVKVAGLAALKDGDSQAEAHLSQVAALIADPNSSVRQAAVDLFGTLGPKAAAQAPAVGKLLAGEHSGVVAAAASALGGIGAEAASEVSALEAILSNKGEDKSTLVLAAAGVSTKAPATFRKPACAAASALASLGTAGAKSAPKVAELLKDKDADLRAASAAALGSMGKDGARFEAQVLELLTDPSPAVVAAACDALGAMALSTSASESTASAVAELLTSTSPAVRAAAARSLGKMGEEAEPFVEALVALFYDASAFVKIEAMKAVGKCGEQGQMYASNVCRLAYDRSEWVRAAACETLAMMGQRGACFADDIEGLLEDPYPEVYYAAQSALEAFANASSGAQMANAVVDGQDAALPAITAAPTASSSTLPVAVLFPGQGSQYVGMLQEAKELPAVKDMLEKAKPILGYDILDLCLQGPENKLEQTKYCQPAMYIAGLAGLEKLRSEKPDVADQLRAVAGLSLGEYTALAVAGVMDFETGLKLVKLRAEAMDEAAQASPQSMASIAGLEKDVLDRLCKEAAGSTDTCAIANFLFPKGFSCAGSTPAIESLISQAQKTPGLLQAKLLKTSGAFHTKLMEPAREKLLTALKDAEPNFKAPTCDVYMNVTGQRLASGTSPSEFVPLLADQLCSCVQWEPLIKFMLEDGITDFYECGPMKQLTAMMKRIDPSAWKKMANIGV